MGEIQKQTFWFQLPDCDRDSSLGIFKGSGGEGSLEEIFEEASGQRFPGTLA